MEEFYIDSDGIRLHAKLDKAPGVDKGPLCILIHGFTGHMEEDHIIAAQKAINDTGVAVLRVEMYGHGKSDGEFKNHTLYKWVTNALSVVAYAKTLDFVTDLYFVTVIFHLVAGNFLTILCQDLTSLQSVFFRLMDLRTDIGSMTKNIVRSLNLIGIEQ